MKEKIEILNPATLEVLGHTPLGKRKDIDKAVEAAKKAFIKWKETSKEERITLLENLLEIYKKR